MLTVAVIAGGILIDTRRWGGTPEARPWHSVILRVLRWQHATRGVNALRRSPLPNARHTQHKPTYDHV